MMYLVTVIKEENRIEVAGIFDTQEKANKAMDKISKWMKDNEFDDYVIYIMPCETNRLAWYEIEENI